PRAICRRDAPWRSTGASSGASGRPRRARNARQSISLPTRCSSWVVVKKAPAEADSRATGAPRAATSPSTKGISRPRRPEAPPPSAMPEAILLKDVEELGERGAVIDVSTGYLRNFLSPRKLAQPATKGAIETVRQRQAAEERAAREAVEKAQENVNLLNRTVL